MVKYISIKKKELQKIIGGKHEKNITVDGILLDGHFILRNWT